MSANAVGCHHWEYCPASMVHSPCAWPVTVVKQRFACVHSVFAAHTEPLTDPPLGNPQQAYNNKKKCIRLIALGFDVANPTVSEQPLQSISYTLMAHFESET